MDFKLRQAREAKGLTQKQLAVSIHKAIATVQSWESGVSYPNAECLWDLCILLDTTPNDILGWWDDHPRPDGEVLDRDESVLISDYRSCTPARKRKAAEAVRDQRDLSANAGASSPSYESEVG